MYCQNLRTIRGWEIEVSQRGLVDFEVLAITFCCSWLQRLHRIITSEELVSPHHSAREMIEVVRNRDFTKLFQKSVKKVSQCKSLIFRHSTF